MTACRNRCTLAEIDGEKNSCSIGAKLRGRMNAPRLLRLTEVMALTGLSRMTIWRLERSGEFPARRQLGRHSVAWLESDVHVWIESRPAVRTPRAVDRRTIRSASISPHAIGVAEPSPQRRLVRR
jgi:prophage regulatory protein